MHLRPMHAGDEAFLRQVYASTRASEIAMTGWDAQAAEAFLRMQFDAQHRHYQQHYGAARFDIVEQGGVPVGRLYVARSPADVRVIDIALLDAFRGQGIGTALLRALLDEAAAAGSSVSVHVEETNPALSLYHRLGFRQVDTQGLYRLMAWRAPAAASTLLEPI
ncbi:GNAT family N-acetyltransferase [Massilia aurea]|uniref:GNAT family N-acetyltransferase n=1 Tax=Massilia aurea TaxID=373040 RepID=UPI0034621480